MGKGEPTATIAREIGPARPTVHDLRKAIQANAARLQPSAFESEAGPVYTLQANAAMLQPQEPLPDRQTETDEMFQNAGERRGTSPSSC